MLTTPKSTFFCLQRDNHTDSTDVLTKLSGLLVGHISEKLEHLFKYTFMYLFLIQGSK